jgi:hypothetical protein
VSPRPGPNLVTVSYYGELDGADVAAAAEEAASAAEDAADEADDASAAAEEAEAAAESAAGVGVEF